jgi:hypothetical protein
MSEHAIMSLLEVRSPLLVLSFFRVLVWDILALILF